MATIVGGSHIIQNNHFIASKVGTDNVGTFINMGAQFPGIGEPTSYGGVISIKNNMFEFVNDGVSNK